MAKAIDKVGCIGNPFIRVNSGGYLDLLDPKPKQFTFRDIAKALSKICRYGSQCDRFYSVAEHSLHCSNVAKDDCLGREVQAACLMHDAAEAFIGDIIKPLKNLLPQYLEIEAKLEAIIESKYSVDFSNASVKQIDLELLFHERRSLFSEDAEVWLGQDKARRLSFPINCYTPDSVEPLFLARAKALGINTEF